MSRGLFDPPAAYRPGPEQMAAPMPEVRAVLFDFSNTLFHMVEAEVWLRRIAEATGRADVPDARLAQALADLDAAFREPEVVQAQAGRDLSPERHWESQVAWWSRVDFLRGHEEAAYRELKAPDAWRPYADTESVLRALRDRAVPVGIVSDFAWDLRIHLKEFGLDGLVDTTVLSCEVGCEKPDPEIFLAACERLSVDPRAALMVGDNPARDGGAVAVGLRALLLPSERRLADRGLAQVLDLLPAR